MSRGCRVTVFLLLGLAIGAVVLPAAGAQPPTVRGAVWVQPAYGVSVKDDRVAGELGAEVTLSDILLIGPISATVPVGVEVDFEDPSGFLVGGEFIYRRFGVEVNVIYLQKAARARGFVPVCGGLLTEFQCDLLRQGTLLTPGIELPDILLVEEDLANLAVTLGGNYHLYSGKTWDVWAGPMIVWSVWDKYDVSDVRVELRTSIESLLQGKVNKFEPSNHSDIAPQNALTLGLNLGARYHISSRWSLQGQFRYFAGDEADLPGGTGSYAVAGFSGGIAYRFGG